MKICVISNSHAASLKDGWSAVHNLVPHIDMTFFAAANRLLEELVADFEANLFQVETESVKNMLSFTSGGLDIIDVKEYDAFLVYGMFLSAPRLDRRHSSAIKRMTIRDSVEQSINYRFVSDLSKMTDAPVYYAPNPLLSDSILEDEVDQAICYHTYDEVCEWIDTHYNFTNAIQVKQLEQTMGHGITTQKKYSTGSVRLTKVTTQHLEQDVMHMNKDYGEMYMKMFLFEAVAKLNRPCAKVA